MCGIFAYSGSEDAPAMVLDGLKSLEYRGYDSWGVASRNGKGISVVRRTGKVGDVDRELVNLGASSFAIGHTRWATHGGVTVENAHPHISNNGKIVVVHNGIIENYQKLRKQLTRLGYEFSSDTDTEVIPILIEVNMTQGMGFFEAFLEMLKSLEGNFAIVSFFDGSDFILGARRGSPLVVGVSDDDCFLSSDIPAFLDHTRDVIFLDDEEVVKINKEVKVYSFDGKEIAKTKERIEWDVESADLGNYPHFMVKEIYEQQSTIMRAVNQDNALFDSFVDMINDAYGVFFVACGTAYHAALSASYYFSNITGKHVNVVHASEFPNYEHFLTDKTLMFCISQSGETADLLEAVKAAKKKGSKVLSIVNVVGSSLIRMSDASMPLNCGVEKCVLATKSYTSQLSLMIMLAYSCAGRGDEGCELMEEVCGSLNEILNEKYFCKVRDVAEKIKDASDIYAIGRSFNYPTAMEAALKIKEVSYIHAEGFPGGEMKHGSIALIDEGTPCLVFVSNDDTKVDIISNAIEVRSRGGYIIGISPVDDESFDIWLPVPDVGLAQQVLNVIPAQILAYYLAVLLDKDPDKPRNLAKSVTVK